MAGRSCRPTRFLRPGRYTRRRLRNPSLRRVAPSFGYGATAWIVGRRILGEPPAWVLAFLVGWGILRILALVPILGGLVWFAAVVFGLAQARQLRYPDAVCLAVEAVQRGAGRRHADPR
jgi:hypothetical protein